MMQRPTIIIDVEVSRQRQPSAMDRFVIICQALVLATVCLVIGIPLLFLSVGALIVFVRLLLA